MMIIHIYGFVGGVLRYCVLGVFCMTNNVIAAVDADPWRQDRKLFDKAMRSVEAGHFTTFRRLRDKLEKYPLYAYLQYAYLRKTIRRTDNRKIETFLERHQELHLSGKMRSIWLRELARRGNWSRFVKQYNNQRNAELRCYYAYALFKSGKQQKAVKIAQKLWQVGKMQPKACIKTFKQYARSGALKQAAIKQRAIAAVKNNAMDLAKFLLKKLKNNKDKQWLRRWLAMQHKPADTLEKLLPRTDNLATRNLVYYGIKRLARRDLELAWQTWHTTKSAYRFSQQQVNKLEQYLAMQSVYGFHPMAAQWFANIKELNSELAQWRIRLAMRNSQWPEVLAWIKGLPGDIKGKENWQYFYARSLHEIGKRDGNQSQINLAANTFKKLAKTRSYYGFLAADRIGSDYQLQLQPVHLDKKRLNRLAKNTGIVRARELFLLQRYAQARMEWHHATGRFKPAEQKLAAILAYSWGWYDRAILTYLKFGAARHAKIDLPYPLVYRAQVIKNAKLNRIDPAWILGVVRQESAFMTDAKSTAGALGLMQLMPSTARLVSRVTKTPLRRTIELLRPEKNIQLGSAYMRMLLDDHNGNAVLATAAYNAGKGRTKKWLPKKLIAADVWVESIPYNETRNYVGNVLTFTVVFDHLLDGKASRLANRMPDIEPIARN